MTKELQACPRRILVAGAPGTGRRTVGTLLELERGFLHLRVGDRAGAGALLHAVSACGADRDVVVTWTAPIAEETIESLRLLDFELVRLDRNRDRRRTSAWRTVDPFDRDGSFRPARALAAELLAPRPAARRCASRPRPWSSSPSPFGSCKRRTTRKGRLR